MKISKNSIKKDSIEITARYLGFEITQDGVEIIFEKDENLNGTNIKKDGNEIKVLYSIEVYIYRALGLILENKEKETYEISETASFSSNGFMIDCSRNAVINVNEAKKLVLKMAVMGYDVLMLYTEDTYEIPNQPYFGYLRGKYSAEEIREIEEYAEQFGIELVPCIQTLAHLPAMFRWAEYAKINDCTDILLVGEEDTYKLIDDMIKTCSTIFKSKKINVGMDEAWLLGCGKYRDQNGFSNRFDIMCEHLNKVNDICKKYGYKPMMWSDMFFNLITGSLYDEEFPISDEMLAKVPEDIKLIFWDYYHRDSKTYDVNIKKHKVFKNETVFAGGAWKWTGFVPNNRHGFVSSKLALDACRGKISTIFLTCWGDNGAEASLNSILPTMQLFSEYNFDAQLTDAKLEKRFKTCFKCDMADFLLLDDLNNTEGILDNYNTNPAKYLLYNDVLLGIFDKHTTAQFQKHYADCATKLENAMDKTGEYTYVFDTLAKLARILELKANIGNDLKAAYDSNNKSELENITDNILPEIKNRVISFHEAVRIQWMKENKPFGFEVLDIRIAGIEARVQSAIYAINDYLNGITNEIMELKEERLYFDCRKEDANVLATACTQYFKIASPGDIA